MVPIYISYRSCHSWQTDTAPAAPSTLHRVVQCPKADRAYRGSFIGPLIVTVRSDYLFLRALVGISSHRGDAAIASANQFVPG